jgi:hypothetical protein
MDEATLLLKQDFEEAKKLSFFFFFLMKGKTSAFISQLLNY